MTAEALLTLKKKRGRKKNKQVFTTWLLEEDEKNDYFLRTTALYTRKNVYTETTLGSKSTEKEQGNTARYTSRGGITIYSHE